MTPRSPLLFSLTGLLCACADPTPGELEIRAWGEDFIEVGVPADELADGWSIEFDRFEISFANISIGGQTLPDPAPLDLSQPSQGRGQLIGRVSLPAGSYTDAEFTVERIDVEGRASKAGVIKRFVWSFPQIVHYSGCETSTEVPAGGNGELQLTAHADHLFYDSLVAEQPALRFDAIAAADADGDDLITMAELRAAELGAYDPGNVFVEDLGQFLELLAGTIMHADGEAHCVGSTS